MYFTTSKPPRPARSRGQAVEMARNAPHWALSDIGGGNLERQFAAHLGRYIPATAQSGLQFDYQISQKLTDLVFHATMAQRIHAGGCVCDSLDGAAARLESHKRHVRMHCRRLRLMFYSEDVAPPVSPTHPAIQVGIPAAWDLAVTPYEGEATIYALGAAPPYEAEVFSHPDWAELGLSAPWRVQSRTHTVFEVRRRPDFNIASTGDLEVKLAAYLARHRPDATPETIDEWMVTLDYYGLWQALIGEVESNRPLRVHEVLERNSGRSSAREVCFEAGLEDLRFESDPRYTVMHARLPGGPGNGNEQYPGRWTW